MAHSPVPSHQTTAQQRHWATGRPRKATQGKARQSKAAGGWLAGCLLFAGVDWPDCISVRPTVQYSWVLRMPLEACLPLTDVRRLVPAICAAYLSFLYPPPPPTHTHPFALPPAVPRPTHACTQSGRIRRAVRLGAAPMRLRSRFAWQLLWQSAGLAAVNRLTVQRSPCRCDA